MALGRSACLALRSRNHWGSGRTDLDTWSQGRNSPSAQSWCMKRILRASSFGRKRPST